MILFRIDEFAMDYKVLRISAPENPDQNDGLVQYKVAIFIRWLVKGESLNQKVS